MSVSDQIIAVLNDLCEKFGVAIDWTAENVMPQVEALCTKYINFEIATSIAWCVIMCAVTIIASIFFATCHHKAKSLDYDWHRGVCCASVVFGIVFGILFFATIMVVGTQTFDIIECKTIPEKVILEYIKRLISSATNR